jgi:hypothetical protein
MAAASYERFPNEGECCLFLWAANPCFEQTRARAGKFVGQARIATSGRSLHQEALVAVIAGEISANRDHRRDCNAQQRCSRAFRIAENDRLPEVEKPGAWPPFGVRLAAGERQRPERRNEKNALYPERDSVENAGGQQIQEKSLKGEENQKRETTGAGHSNEGGRDKHQRARVLLPAAGYCGREKYRPGKIYRENVSAEQDRQRAGFHQEDVAGADRKTGQREAIASIGK